MTNGHVKFVIRHSSFVIRHSSFVIRHSSFVILGGPRGRVGPEGSELTFDTHYGQ
ncbi:MAG TPA: hypothetical protein VGO11_04395 [Chthoniobacteraceae bacterium]|nr:hypothetical protein [Chthoniobacteraceae bacterium]